MFEASTDLLLPILLKHMPDYFRAASTAQNGKPRADRDGIGGVSASERRAYVTERVRALTGDRQRRTVRHADRLSDFYVP